MGIFNMSDFKWIECSCRSCEEKLQVYSRQQEQIYFKIQQINSDKALANILQDEDNDGETDDEISNTEDADESNIQSRKRRYQIDKKDTEEKKQKKNNPRSNMMNCTRCQCLNCEAKDKKLMKFLMS